MNWLNKIEWYYKIMAMIIGSFLNTTLPLPPPFNFADFSYVAALEAYHNIWWYLIVIITMTLTDTFFAVLTYYYSFKLIPLFVKKEKGKEKLESLKEKLGNSKWSGLWLMLACATPLPYTLSIYAAAIINYDTKKFLIINLIGRCVKYFAVALALHFGIKIFQ